VPELLADQQPADLSQFAGEKSLGFEYRYPIVPHGLLPQFIVRIHHLSEG